MGYKGRPYVHGIPMAQPSAVPTAPGVHLSSGGQGQVVVTVGMGSNFYNVSGGKTLDQLRGLQGQTERTASVRGPRIMNTARHFSTACLPLTNSWQTKRTRASSSGQAGAGLCPAPAPTERRPRAACMTRLPLSNGNSPLQVRSSFL